MSLEDYKITFVRHELFGFWTWSVVTPDGRRFSGLGFFASKQRAQEVALAAIKRDAPPETLTGQELAEQIERTSE